MKLNSLVVALLLGWALPLAAPAAIVVNLGTDQNAAKWTDLSNGRLSGYGSYPGASPWPAPIASDAGTTGRANWNKTGGFAFVASGSVYPSGGTGATFSITSTATAGVLDINTLIFQVDSANSGVDPGASLSWNGGSQRLAATWTSTTAGAYPFTNPTDGQSGTTTNFAWQWDLSSITDAVTSINITWNQPIHGAVYGANLDYGGAPRSTSLISAVPEPGALALAGLGFAGLLLRRRR